MGKSGYLPDISSSFGFWRGYAVNCLQDKDWRGAIGGLNNLNSLLTEDYIVTINTEEYIRQTKELYSYQCSFCEEVTPKKDLIFYEKPLSSNMSLILNQEKLQSWQCPKCLEDMPVQGTSVILEKNDSPFFLKVVPEPPRPGPGLLVRFTWEPAFKKWFYNFLEQLTHQLALYRIEYVNQHGEEMPEIPMGKE